MIKQALLKNSNNVWEKMSFRYFYTNKNNYIINT